MDKKILKQYCNDGLSQRQIGQKIGVNQTSVRHLLYKNNLKTKNKKHGGKLESNKQCVCCKEIIQSARISSTRKYCSKKCQMDNQNKIKIDKWLSGEWDGMIGAKYKRLSKTIRDYLLKQANYECSQCRWGKINEFSQLSTLQIDHVDGDWRNNRPENLRVLCPNCHSLTNTFGSMNRGSGRKFRHKYSKRRS